MFRQKRPASGAAVLSLSPDLAEWFDGRGGRPSYGSAPVQGEGAGALVAAAEAAQAAAGTRRRPCVLVASAPLVHHQHLRLPPLGRRDLDQVLARRAAKAFGEDAGEVHYHALGSGSEAGGTDPQEPWTLLAMQRGPWNALFLQLRERGFRVRRAVSGRQAVIDAARVALQSPEQVAVILGVEPRAITLSLVRGATVLHQEAIEGDFLTNPAIASSLVHEVRSFIGYWKKESRGEQVGELVLFGMSPDRSRLLRTAFEAALDGVRVTSLPDGDESELAGRYAYFDAARRSGPLNPDLTPWLPPPRSALTAAGLVVLGLAAAAGWRIQGYLGERAAGLAADARSLEDEARELTTLNARNERARSRVDHLSACAERARQVAAAGIDTEGILGEALSAFHGRATLMDFDLRPTAAGAGFELVLGGRVDASPGRLLAALGGLKRSLEASGRFHSVELVLPDAVPSSGAPGELDFLVDTRLGG